MHLDCSYIQSWYHFTRWAFSPHFRWHTVYRKVKRELACLASFHSVILGRSELAQIQTGRVFFWARRGYDRSEWRRVIHEVSHGVWSLEKCVIGGGGILHLKLMLSNEDGGEGPPHFSKSCFCPPTFTVWVRYSHLNFYKQCPIPKSRWEIQMRDGRSCSKCWFAHPSHQ